MGITAVAIAVGVAAITAAYVVTTRSGLHTALAGQGTAVGLADPAADTVATGGRTAKATDWQLTTVDDLSAAEDLLDCLEAHGYEERELVVTGNSTFAIRWR
jgi:hypothetical protein